MSRPSSDVLARHGWDDSWARLAADAPSAPAPSAPDIRRPGRVARVDRGRVDVVTATGRVRARTTGGLAVGDWILLVPDDGATDGPPAVAAVLPRRTLLARAAASGRSEPQLLAANVDTVVVVVAHDGRRRAGLVERLLALAWESGAVPVVVLTKTDHEPDAVGAVLADLATAAPGVEVAAVSAVTGEGLATLRALVRGTVVLVGPSGAGKSTLANALLGEDRLATGQVRSVDGKGRHTTAHRELIALPGGGVLIDTPGLRGVGLHEAAEGVEQAFVDVVELARDCRFTDCDHDREPGCAVRAAVDAGALPERRMANYRRLRREEQQRSTPIGASRVDARSAAQRRDRSKALSKAQRAMYRERGER